MKNWNWIKVFLVLLFVSAGVSHASTFDGDTASDLFVADNASRAVWYESSGASFTQTILTGNTISIAVGDVDGDATMDLFVGKNAISGSTVTFATYYESNGDNAIAWRKNFSETGTAGASSISIGDLDGDGKGNLMMVRSDSRLLHYEGTSDDAGLIGQIINTGVSSHLGDFDGDSTCDFFIGRTDQHNWYESNGVDNGFGGVKNVSGSYGAPVKDWALGDFDDDGVQDLFMLMGGENEGRIRRFEANGNNDWVERSNIVVPGAGRNCLAIGDLDNDGIIELMVGTDSGIDLYQDGTVDSVGNVILDPTNPGVMDMGFVQGVPEPATATLLIGGMIAGFVRRKRRL